MKSYAKPCGHKGVTIPMSCSHRMPEYRDIWKLAFYSGASELCKVSNLVTVPELFLELSDTLHPAVGSFICHSLLVRLQGTAFLGV